jgi:hypothetical protein
VQQRPSQSKTVVIPEAPQQKLSLFVGDRLLNRMKRPFHLIERLITVLRVVRLGSERAKSDELANLIPDHYGAPTEDADN